MRKRLGDAELAHREGWLIKHGAINLIGQKAGDIGPIVKGDEIIARLHDIVTDFTRHR